MDWFSIIDKDISNDVARTYVVNELEDKLKTSDVDTFIHSLFDVLTSAKGVKQVSNVALLLSESIGVLKSSVVLMVRDVPSCVHRQAYPSMVDTVVNCVIIPLLSEPSLPPFTASHVSHLIQCVYRHNDHSRCIIEKLLLSLLSNVLTSYRSQYDYLAVDPKFNCVKKQRAQTAARGDASPSSSLTKNDVLRNSMHDVNMEYMDIAMSDSVPRDQTTVQILRNSSRFRMILGVVNDLNARSDDFNSALLVILYRAVTCDACIGGTMTTTSYIPPILADLMPLFVPDVIGWSRQSNAECYIAVISTVASLLYTYHNADAVHADVTYAVLARVVPSLILIGAHRQQWFWNVLIHGLSRSERYVIKRAVYAIKYTASSSSSSLHTTDSTPVGMRSICTAALSLYDDVPVGSFEMPDPDLLRMFVGVFENSLELQAHLVHSVWPKLNYLMACLPGRDVIGVTVPRSYVPFEWLLTCYSHLIMHDNLGVRRTAAISLMHVPLTSDMSSSHSIITFYTTTYLKFIEWYAGVAGDNVLRFVSFYLSVFESSSRKREFMTSFLRTVNENQIILNKEITDNAWRFYVTFMLNIKCSVGITQESFGTFSNISSRLCKHNRLSIHMLRVLYIITDWTGVALHRLIALLYDSFSLDIYNDNECRQILNNIMVNMDVMNVDDIPLRHVAILGMLGIAMANNRDIYRRLHHACGAMMNSNNIIDIDVVHIWSLVTDINTLRIVSQYIALRHDSATVYNIMNNIMTEYTLHPSCWLLVCMNEVTMAWYRIGNEFNDKIRRKLLIILVDVPVSMLRDPSVRQDKMEMAEYCDRLLDNNVYDETGFGIGRECSMSMGDMSAASRWAALSCLLPLKSYDATLTKRLLEVLTDYFGSVHLALMPIVMQCLMQASRDILDLEHSTAEDVDVVTDAITSVIPAVRSLTDRPHRVNVGLAAWSTLPELLTAGIRHGRIEKIQNILCDQVESGILSSLASHAYHSIHILKYYPKFMAGIMSFLSRKERKPGVTDDTGAEATASHLPMLTSMDDVMGRMCGTITCYLMDQESKEIMTNALLDVHDAVRSSVPAYKLFDVYHTKLAIIWQALNVMLPGMSDEACSRTFHRVWKILVDEDHMHSIRAHMEAWLSVCCSRCPSLYIDHVLKKMTTYDDSGAVTRSVLSITYNVIRLSDKNVRNVLDLSRVMAVMMPHFFTEVSPQRLEALMAMTACSAAIQLDGDGDKMSHTMANACLTFIQNNVEGNRAVSNVMVKANISSPLIRCLSTSSLGVRGILWMMSELPVVLGMQSDVIVSKHLIKSCIDRMFSNTGMQWDTMNIKDDDKIDIDVVMSQYCHPSTSVSTVNTGSDVSVEPDKFCVLWNVVDLFEKLPLTLPFSQSFKQSELRYTSLGCMTLSEMSHLNYQRKIDVGGDEYGPPLAEVQRSGLVVFGSFIDKLTNLGGICRTCEVFNVERLAINDTKDAATFDFKVVAMTSENWQPMVAVPVTDTYDEVIRYLITMRNNGYELVGVEQTSESQSLDKFEFKYKTVLIMGREKEGIPEAVLNVLDRCVEIKQYGKIRSLNVHVAASLVIHKYTEQHMH